MRPNDSHLIRQSAPPWLHGQTVRAIPSRRPLEHGSAYFANERENGITARRGIPPLSPWENRSHAEDALRLHLGDRLHILIRGDY